MEQILELIKNPLVAGIVALIIGKLIPDSKIAWAGEKLGIMCTLGFSRLFPGVWAKVEKWLINAIDVFIKAWFKGLRSDN